MATPVPHVSGHVKSVFVYRNPPSYGSNVKKTFHIGLLLDDGRVFIEKLMFFPIFGETTRAKKSNLVNRYNTQFSVLASQTNRMKQSIFRKYEIDGRTHVVFADTIDGTKDYLYFMFDFCRSFLHFPLKISHRKSIVTMLKHYFGFSKMNTISKTQYEKLKKSKGQVENKLGVLFNNIYKKLLAMGTCPWISNATEVKLHLLSRRERQDYIYVLVGLVYCTVSSIRKKQQDEFWKRKNNFGRNYVETEKGRFL